MLTSDRPEAAGKSCGLLAIARAGDSVTEIPLIDRDFARWSTEISDIRNFLMSVASCIVPMLRMSGFKVRSQIAKSFQLIESVYKKLGSPAPLK